MPRKVSSIKPENRAVGALLREIREQRGLTLEKLADYTGIRPVTLRQYESGMRSPGYENIKRLVQGLGISGVVLFRKIWERISAL